MRVAAPSVSGAVSKRERESFGLPLDLPRVLPCAVDGSLNDRAGMLVHFIPFSWDRAVRRATAHAINRGQSCALLAYSF